MGRHTGRTSHDITRGYLNGISAHAGRVTRGPYEIDQDFTNPDQPDTILIGDTQLIASFGPSTDKQAGKDAEFFWYALEGFDTLATTLLHVLDLCDTRPADPLAVRIRHTIDARLYDLATVNDLVWREESARLSHQIWALLAHEKEEQP